MEELESKYTYTGLPQNVTSKEGHRTSLQINKFKEKPYNDWIYTCSYQVDQKGYEHRFDIEFLGLSTLSVLYNLLLMKLTR